MPHNTDINATRLTISTNTAINYTMCYKPFLIKNMEQWTAPACGSIRIKNPKTLQAWIDKGWYQREIDDGYIFAPNCGRFRTKKCECSKCKKVNGGKVLKDVLALNGL